MFACQILWIVIVLVDDWLSNILQSRLSGAAAK